MKLTKAQRDFMKLLSGGPLSRKNLPPVLSREEDRMRQGCRQAGLTRYVAGTGWELTDAGRAALQAEDKP